MRPAPITAQQQYLTAGSPISLAPRPEAARRQNTVAMCGPPRKTIACPSVIGTVVAACHRHACPTLTILTVHQLVIGASNAVEARQPLGSVSPLPVPTGDARRPLARP